MVRIEPSYCVADNHSQKAAVEKVEAKEKPEISFAEVLQREEKRLEHQA